MTKGSGINSENKSLLIPTANDTVEVFFAQSGTESTSNPYVWYFNLEDAAHGISVKADKISQITHINNRELKSPINIKADGSFSDNIANYFAHMHYIQIKIKVLNNSTLIEVFGRV